MRKASLWVAPPPVACTTRMPSPEVAAPGPPAFSIQRSVVPLAIPCLITSRSDGDPSSRAAAEGFPNGVGENVCLGYGDAETWTRGWYRASDHHRNGLLEMYNCFGYGYSGSVGTQAFATIGAPF